MTDIRFHTIEGLVERDQAHMRAKRFATSLVNASLEEIAIERRISLDFNEVKRLSAFPHITKVIFEKWGTVYLDKYLNNLLTDTRGGTRKGFPFEASNAIFSLITANKLFLSRLGIDPSKATDDPWHNLS
jgi:hypothetical protein